MTTQPVGPPPGAVVVPQAAKVQKVRFKIEPQPEGQLEQLLIQFAEAYDENEVAKEKVADLKAQIKAWLLSLYPDGKGLPDGFDLTGDPHGRYPGYSMTYKRGKTTDTDAMKQDGIYERYLKSTTPSWELREATQGGRR